ncbi:MAG: carboxypeptidase-like regulatory domain-containing protein [Tannerellaceae bacterium]|jgi:hypothetical protein|nr:carboxypeptidase-like regulatory domain-containing protein [Tannerellaceae bacterium]
MKKLFYISLVLLSSIVCSAYAQSPVSACVQGVEGSVLPYANVLFFQHDSLAGGVYTDDKGCFTIRMDTGAYVMTVSYVGYKDHTEDIQLTAEGLHVPPPRYADKRGGIKRSHRTGKAANR